MNIVLLGPPGSGKSTFARPLIKRHNLSLIATGQRLRDEVEQRTPLGHVVAGHLERGELVPDDLMDQLLAGWLREVGPGGFLLDGYPRTEAQALALEHMLAGLGLTLDAVITLELSDDEAVRRLGGRRMCEGAGEPFPVHLDDAAGLQRCQERGGTLTQREDDKPDVVRQRLTVYHQQTAPLISFYQARGLLRSVDAHGSPSDVIARVEAALAPSSSPV